MNITIRDWTVIETYTDWIEYIKKINELGIGGRPFDFDHGQEPTVFPVMAMSMVDMNSVNKILHVFIDRETLTFGYKKIGQLPTNTGPAIVPIVDIG